MKSMEPAVSAPTAPGADSSAAPARPTPQHLATLLKVLGTIPRGKGLLWHVILPLLPRARRRLVHNPCGFWMTLDLYQLLDFEYAYGIHDAEEIAFLLDAYEEGTHFVDVGANQGFYSLYLASRCANARIIAFEPDPYSLEKFRKNISMNRFDNITILPCAIADDDSPRTLRIVSPRNRGANSLLSGAGPDCEGMEVPCRPLLSALREEGVERISAMKIDVEGFEYPVLRSFLSEAPRAMLPRAVVVEALGDRIGVVGGSPIDILIEHGYRTVNHGRFNFLMKLRDR